MSQHRILQPRDMDAFSRRDLLTLIGKAAGGGAMYHAMTSLGFAAESSPVAVPRLEGAKKGTSVLILGAGLAGMTAALELRSAGYSVKILEYTQRAGGRCWSLRGGDTLTELGGARQKCDFAQGEYFNAGPMRIPFHHHAVLSYCRRFGIALEPFTQVNYNALVHSSKAFDAKPQRYRHVQSDYQGYVAELLGKAALQGNLDTALTKEDKEKLLEGLRRWGALDSQHRYREGAASSDRRGYDIDPGGGLMSTARFSKPLQMSELIQSRLWRYIANGLEYELQSPMFQPVGGMDKIAQGFAKEVGGLIHYGAKITKIEQSDRGVTVTYVDARQGTVAQEKADWCLCTVPLSVLGQLDLQVGSAMKEAIDAVPYASSVKVGLQFKRRFWEEDEHIYGGVSYTDLPIARVGYPSSRPGAKGKSVLLGAYLIGGPAPNSYEFAGMAPDERLKWALKYGAQIHPQYAKEFDNGISMAWHRMPGQLGCFGMWTDESRAKHYKNLCQIDGRIALAGEHASYLPAWQEGAILSSWDAIARLHARAVA